MASIRRGAAPGARGDDDSAARVNGAIIVSRNGSDRAMPVPRRNRRREIAWRVEANGAETASFDFEFMAIGLAILFGTNHSEQFHARLCADRIDANWNVARFVRPLHDLRNAQARPSRR